MCAQPETVIGEVGIAQIPYIPFVSEYCDCFTLIVFFSHCCAGYRFHRMKQQRVEAK